MVVERKDVEREDFLLKNPHLREFMPFLDELDKESPRGKVLIASSYVDDQLRQILKAVMIQAREVEKLLEGFNAPLGTLSSRATAAYVMGLISQKEYDECNKIRAIRNKFAHAVQMSFDDPSVIDLCRGLNFKAPDYRDVVIKSEGQFTSAAISLVMNLVNRAAYVAQHRLEYREWKY
jgi:DNA-binding MltR family transcriptional regulator